MDCIKRCGWVNLQNPLYVAYHDQEWGKPNHDDHYLFEMLVLESFQAGLSWECVLNKRDNFRRAFDNFDVQKVANYDEYKITELLTNAGIIRNCLKIKAAIVNAKVFQRIQSEYGTFDQYLGISPMVKWWLIATEYCGQLRHYQMPFRKIYKSAA